VNPYEALGVAFGVVAVWLTVRENVWCWPLGIVNVCLSAVVFAQARLYADAGLQLVYVALCAYGWHSWLHGGPTRGALAVARAPVRTLLVLGAAGVAFAAALGVFLAGRTNAALPYWDAGTASFSLVAQWMQARKWVENWALWIVVDAVYVGMYVAKSLFLMAGLYLVFLGLALAGLLAWRAALLRPVVTAEAGPPR
jgi:nicotinamide mononucleotide transporter